MMMRFPGLLHLDRIQVLKSDGINGFRSDKKNY